MPMKHHTSIYILLTLKWPDCPGYKKAHHDFMTVRAITFVSIYSPTFFNPPFLVKATFSNPIAV